MGGVRLFNRGSLPLLSFLKAEIRVCSNFLASSGYSTHLKRKYFTFIKRFIFLCELSLDLMEVSLLPMYTTTCFASPSSYAPGLSGTKSVLSLKEYHFVPIGIFHPLTLLNAIIAAFRLRVNEICEATLCQLVFTSVDYKVTWVTSRASYYRLATASNGEYSK